jgi:hypothetical protein
MPGESAFGPVSSPGQLRGRIKSSLMANPQTPTPPAAGSDLPAKSTPPRPIFGGPPTDASPRSGVVFWSVVGVLALVLVGLGVFLRGGHASSAGAPNSILPPDGYAGSLSFTQLAMSQSTSLSGGTSTFLDGHVHNTGAATVTGVTMQVIFRNDVGLSPQVETLPLSLIRTHEPYIDTEPVSAAPLKPGDDAEFRLVFESVAGNWNQQMPELTAVRVARR